MLGDLRFAFRALVQRRGFTISAVLTLALGIGANSAVFTVIESVLLRPLPYPRADRLVAVSSTTPGLSFQNSVFSASRAADWRAARAFSGLAAWTNSGRTLTGTGDPLSLRVARVEPDFFSVFDTRPAAGRTFSGTDAGGNFVILSYGLWTQRFGGDPSATGRSIRLDDVAYTVVGVMPAEFRYPYNADAWVPLVLTSAEQTPGLSFLSIVARLRDGVGTADASRELQALAHEGGEGTFTPIGRAPAARAGDPQIVVSTLLEREVGSIRPRLLLFAGAVGVVLLIACVNVANLLLARAVSRRSEVAVRLALGVSRWRLMRQLLAESLLLSILGCGLGILIGAWMVRMLVAMQPNDIPRLDNIGVRPLALGFAALVSILSGTAAGLVPALHAMRTNVIDGLRGTRRGGTVAGSQRLQGILVIFEVALTLTLLVGGAVLLASFMRIVAVDPGLSPERVLAFEVSLPPARYAEEVNERDFLEQALGRLRALPGVQSATAAFGPPFSGLNFASVIRSVGGGAGKSSPLYVSVSGGYFETLKIPLKQGRYLSDADRESSPRSAVISEALANSLWPGEDPLAARFTMGATPDVWQVVGVVADVHHGSLQSERVPTLYLPVMQQPARLLTFMVRTESDDPVALLSAVRSQMSIVDSRLPLQAVGTMRQRVDKTVARPRFYSTVLGVFAAMALALALLGVYGLVSYFVSQRKHDLAVHVALGARAPEVVALAIRTGLGPVIAGVALGIGMALALGRMLQSTAAAGSLQGLLFHARTDDLGPVAIAAAALVASALVACYFPARRASLVDPAAALRSE